MATERPALAVEDLALRFDSRDQRGAVDGLGFEVAHGQWYTLLGPSGCGKTTTLRMVAGLEVPDRGRVVIDGDVVSSDETGIFVPAHKRGLGMVFQSYGIWPHMTVFDNAAFPLRMSRIRLSKRELRQRVDESLAMVQLSDYAGRMATQLSGGQQQRLALARAIVHRPKLLLLDEPLSNLDANLRSAMREKLVSLQRGLGLTTLYVTHDQEEALSMSDRVAVMSEGRIAQEGRPYELYHRPLTPFVASFLGVTNVFQGVVRGVDERGVHVESELGLVVARTAAGAVPGASVLIAVRAERARIRHHEPTASENVVEGAVERVMFLGDRVDCQVRIGGRLVIARDEFGWPSWQGERVWVELPADSLMVITGGDGSARSTVEQAFVESTPLASTAPEGTSTNSASSKAGSRPKREDT